MHAVRNWLIGGVIAVLLNLNPLVCRGATNVPDVINLDSLAKYYEPVKFKHAEHIEMTKDCANCHHHTTGSLVEDRNCIRCHANSGETKKVACRACHAAEPFSAASLKAKDPRAYHTDKPGLKRAYHKTCLGCHQKNGGPTGCEDCHARTKEGDKLYNAGEYAPKKSVTEVKSGH